MHHAERRFASDAVISRIITLSGLDLANLPWKEDEDSGRNILKRRIPNGGHLTLHANGEAEVRWPREAPEHPVTYSLDDKGAIATLERISAPETVLEGMAGKRLSEVVDIPGAEEMVIEVAVNSRAFPSDPNDIRIAAVPAAGCA